MAKARERSDRAGFAPCASRLCAVAYSGSSTHWGGGGAPSTGVARIFQQGEGRGGKARERSDRAGFAPCASRLCAVAYSGSSTHWERGAPSTGVARIFQQGEGRGGKARERSDRAGFAPCASRLCAVAYSGSSTHWEGGHRALA